MAKPEDIQLDDKANQWDRIVTADDSTEIANKAIIARYVYATNLMDLDSFDGYVAEDYVEDQPIPGQEPGIEGLKEAYKIFAGPFSDAVFVFADLFCEGDLVFGRGEISGTNDGEFFGNPPTGKKVSWTGTRLFRLKDNKVTHGWFNVDFAGMLVQLGLAPAPPGPPPPDPPPVMPTGAPGTREECKAIMRKLIDEVWAKGDLDLADELFHPEAICPSAPTLPVGPEGTKMIVQMVRNAFSGLLGADRPDRRRGRPRRRPHHAGRHARPASSSASRRPARPSSGRRWRSSASATARSSPPGSTATSRG